MLISEIPLNAVNNSLTGTTEIDATTLRYPIAGLPAPFSVFFEDYLKAMEVRIKSIPEITKKEVTIVDQGYIALKSYNETVKGIKTIRKPLHFLTMFPLLKSNALRFVFPASTETITKYITGNRFSISNHSLSLVTNSAMGASFTLCYRLSNLGKKEGEFYIKEKPSFICNVEDVAELALLALNIVIDKKQ